MSIQMSIGAEGDLGALGSKDDFASMIRTNPSARQMLLEMVTEKDPALGQQLSQNPALLESFLQNMDSTQADQEDHPSFQIDMFNTEERAAIQRVSINHFVQL
jgi:hypothetical protein